MIEAFYELLIALSFIVIIPLGILILLVMPLAITGVGHIFDRTKDPHYYDDPHD